MCLNVLVDVFFDGVVDGGVEVSADVVCDVGFDVLADTGTGWSLGSFRAVCGGGLSSFLFRAGGSVWAGSLSCLLRRLVGAGGLFWSLCTRDSRSGLGGWVGDARPGFFEDCRDDSANDRDGDEEDDLFQGDTCV
ncbi:MAG: hypothetical protein RLZZ458_1466 [Planctomycetota bacterium]